MYELRFSCISASGIFFFLLEAVYMGAKITHISLKELKDNT